MQAKRSWYLKLAPIMSLGYCARLRALSEGLAGVSRVGRQHSIGHVRLLVWWSSTILVGPGRPIRRHGGSNSPCLSLESTITGAREKTLVQ